MNRNQGRVNNPGTGDEGSDSLEIEESVPSLNVTPTNPPQPGFGAATGDLTWTNPTYYVTLPSRGRFYPPGHPLHNQEQLEIKYMTAAEEDLLTSQALLKKGIAVERVLENLLVDKSVKVDDLMLGDKNALTIGARITGYGSAYKALVTCPACGEDTDFEFNLENIKANDWEEALDLIDAQLTPRNTILMKLPVTEVEVELRFMTGRDEKKLAEEAKRKSRKNMQSTSLTDSLRTFIVSINGIDSPFAIANFVQSMPAQDSRKLRVAYGLVAPNVDMIQEFECDKCGHNADLEVPLGANFFWPQ